MPATRVDEPLLPHTPLDCSGYWSPAVDVRHTVTIEGARRDRLRTSGVPFRLERPTGRLHRSLQLPDGNKLSAQIHDGVLEVHIPKVARSGGRKLACANR